jgi:ligand-binding sensor domain-containing protein/signal transduction histidine kinase
MPLIRVRCSFARLLALLASCLCLSAATVSVRAVESRTDPDFAIQSWDRRQGVPATVINDIQRAPNGYLWLATQKGLVRFDGERFRLFVSQSNPELRTNWVNCALVDTSGALWIATAADLLYYPSGRPGAENPTVIKVPSSVKALTLRADNSVWALCEKNEILRFSGSTIAGHRIIPGDESMRLLLAGKDGVQVMAASSQKITLLKNGEFLPVVQDWGFKARPDLACPRKLGGFWIAAERGVACVSESNGTVMVTSIQTTGESPGSAITALEEDKTGRLWAGTREGVVHCLSPAATTAEPSIWRQVTPKRLRSLGPVSCLYEDPEGLIWAGTTGGYLHQIKRRVVTAWSLPLLNQENIPHTVCVARDGVVWVGTDGAGVYRYQDRAVAHFGPEMGATFTSVMAMFEDSRTNLWLGTANGLFRFENGRFQPELAAILTGRPVPSLFEDPDGSLWFGTDGEVIRKQGENIKRFSLGRGVEVRALAKGRRNELWIGTRGSGIFRLRNEQVEKYDRFQRPGVQSLYCDHHGILWVGTITRGLFRIAGNHIYEWSSADGLPSSWVHSIIEDSSGTLWLGSNEGIYGVTKQALMERIRSKDSPLLTIQVASPEIPNWSSGSGQPSAAKGPDGRLWFPAGHGVLSFNPAELMRTRPALPVLIEEVLVDGVERAAAPSAPPLKIYSGMKRLELRYTIADLDSPGQLKFRYKLEGLDDKWIDGGAQRSASYGPLPPGKYSFSVISAGSANAWTATANPVQFEIVPHLWETQWFRGCAAVLILSVVGAAAHFIGRAKFRRKLERLQMHQAMEKERQRIARDLHDDLGSAITEIMLLSELAKGENGVEPIGVSQIRSQLNHITRKAQQVATSMDEIVWTINPKNDSLPDLASYLCDYATEFLRAAQVSSRIDVSESFPGVPVSAQQRYNLFLAVKEALNNAVKHSGASEVWLRIHWSERDFVIALSVEDNGRGFAPAPPGNGSGNGLANMRARLSSLGGHTEIASDPGSGTKVRFTLVLPAHSIERLAGAPQTSDL